MSKDKCEEVTNPLIEDHEKMCKMRSYSKYNAPLTPFHNAYATLTSLEKEVCKLSDNC